MILCVYYVQRYTKFLIFFYFSAIYYSLDAGNSPEPVLINLAAPQQIKQACLRSACTSFDAEITCHVFHANKGFIKSLFQLLDSLPQFRILLNYYLRLRLGKHLLCCYRVRRLLSVNCK